MIMSVYEIHLNCKTICKSQLARIEFLATDFYQIFFVTQKLSFTLDI